MSNFKQWSKNQFAKLHGFSKPFYQKEVNALSFGDLLFNSFGFFFILAILSTTLLGFSHFDRAITVGALMITIGFVYWVIRRYVKKSYGWFVTQPSLSRKAYFKSLLKDVQTYVVLMIEGFLLVVIIDSVLRPLQLKLSLVGTNLSVGTNYLIVGALFIFIQPLIEGIVFRGWITDYVKAHVQNKYWQFFIPVILAATFRSLGSFVLTSLWFALLQMIIYQYVRQKYNIWTSIIVNIGMAFMFYVGLS